MKDKATFVNKNIREGGRGWTNKTYKKNLSTSRFIACSMKIQIPNTCLIVSPHHIFLYYYFDMGILVDLTVATKGQE